MSATLFWFCLSLLCITNLATSIFSFYSGKRAGRIEAKEARKKCVDIWCNQQKDKEE